MAESSSSLATKLLNIKDYSDLTLECDEQEFRVHRATVCAQSPVIAAALRGDFMEAKMGVLHMSFDIDSVRRLIEFMYSGDYQISYNPALDILASSAPSKNCTAEKQAKEIEIVDDSVDNTAKLDMSIDVLEPSESISGRLLFHGRMNSIADYYDVSALAKLSTARVKEILAKEWSVEPFCNLLQQCIGSTSDKDFLRMLGAEAVEHVGELSERNFFDEGGLAEGLAPYALPYCAQRLKTAEGRGRGLESSLLFEKEAGLYLISQKMHVDRIFY
ncbi:hypothetical protein F4823DRAFT_630450 [Ustulina deusta]|nr:hypothetical protein F4823DRAFT_630450 [Ustulina deusta]